MAGVYTIPPECPFADTLAAHVQGAYGADPLTLSRVTLLLPNRRACDALRDCFLELSGGAPLLPPTLLPLGDVDADDLSLRLFAQSGAAESLGLLAPAAPALHRTLVLAELVWKFHASAFGHAAPRDHAVWLARELARFLDEAEREELPLDALERIVPELFAGHWQQSLAFLSVLSQHYEPLMREQNLMSPVRRRNRLLHALAQQWRKTPPDHPVLIAGSTGTNPATASLMRVVAALPHGAVVLPGLDRRMSDSAWEEAGDTHPQYVLRLLLERLGVERKGVALIEGKSACQPERAVLLTAALLPAAATAAWPTLKVDPGAALSGVEYIPCDTAEDEAQIVALILRDALEVPGKTAALVTHDRALARRVAALMRRFGVVIDDSAGKPLSRTSAGTFFRLALEAARAPAAPVPLLALLKHPLAHAGLSAAECRKRARTIECHALRGSRPASDKDMRHRLAQAQEKIPGEAEAIAAALDLLNRLAPCFEAFGRMLRAENPIRLEELLVQHLRCVEMLCADETGASALQGSEGGAALLDFVQEAIAQAGVASPIEPRTYPGILEALLSGEIWRPAYGQHPRLHILSPQEARLQSFDRVILGGLNEGSWPPDPDADPWMSRAMRVEFGLPTLEKKISQAAHDFVMQWAAAELFLTRAAKTGGVVTTPSRWVARLEALVRGKGGQLAARPWQEWLRQMQATPTPALFARPAPVPPMAARPRALHVTRIETLLRDPYALYASHILNLRPLEPVDEEPDARHFGSLAHAALARFARDYPEALPDEAESILLGYGKEIFREIEGHSTQHTLWWERFIRLAAWVIGEEKARRPGLRRVAAEIEGKCAFAAPGGEFALRARADRLEVAADGGLRLIDYKTGAPPAPHEIESGYACQLPLEAAIAEAGGFAGIKGSVAGLEYWRLKGTADGGEIRHLKNAEALKQQAWKGVQALIARYDNPAQAYTATPLLEEKPAYNNEYEHLERLDEWSS